MVLNFYLIKTLEMLHKFLELFVTCFKIGYIPIAPGTFGTIFSILIWFFIESYSLLIKSLIIIIFFIVGVYASEIISKMGS